MGWSLYYTPEAQTQKDWLTKKRPKLLKKLLQIEASLMEDPLSPAFKFEPLKYQFSGFFSKRLDQANRIVYTIDGPKILVTIVACVGHYNDK